MQILEMILMNMDNKNQLLPLRLVNSIWKSVATSVLQRQCHDFSTSWNREDLGSRTRWLPTLTLVPANRKHGGLSTAFFPRGSSPLPRGTNPFVTNSLILASAGPGTFRNIGERKRVSVYKLLQNHGEYLTSLQICEVKTSQVELYMLLQQTPNLKALKLKLWPDNHVAIGTGISESVTLVPKLTHLTFHGCSGKIRGWLLKMLAPQLIHLDLFFAYVVMPFNVDDYVDLDTTGRELRPFHQLKRLRILTREFILGTRVQLPIPLECLSLELCSGCYELSVEEVTGFIDRYFMFLLLKVIKLN